MFGIAVMVFANKQVDAVNLFNSIAVDGTDVTDDDWYAMTLGGSQTTLSISTSTPGDGAGEFVNILNPRIELYQNDGTTLVAVGTLLPDGRNESIMATGLTAGTTYRIHVVAENGTRGEYFLSAKSTVSAKIAAGIVNNVTDVWQTVTLSQSFVNPIVIVGPMGNNDPDPGTVRIRNVTATTFEIQINEWDYLDGIHGAETVNYIATLPGVGNSNGLLYEININPNVNHRAFAQRFTQNFLTPPRFLATMQTYNEADPGNVRLRALTARSYTTIIEEERSLDFEMSHADEVVGYFAFRFVPVPQQPVPITASLGTSRGANDLFSVQTALAVPNQSETLTNVSPFFSAFPDKLTRLVTHKNRSGDSIWRYYSTNETGLVDASATPVDSTISSTSDWPISVRKPF